MEDWSGVTSKIPLLSDKSVFGRPLTHPAPMKPERGQCQHLSSPRIFWWSQKGTQHYSYFALVDRVMINDVSQFLYSVLAWPGRLTRRCMWSSTWSVSLCRLSQNLYRCQVPQSVHYLGLNSSTKVINRQTGVELHESWLEVILFWASGCTCSSGNKNMSKDVIKY